jgi:hypothetical protein
MKPARRAHVMNFLYIVSFFLSLFFFERRKITQKLQNDTEYLKRE